VGIAGLDERNVRDVLLLQPGGDTDPARSAADDDDLVVLIGHLHSSIHAA